MGQINARPMDASLFRRDALVSAAIDLHSLHRVLEGRLERPNLTLRADARFPLPLCPFCHQDLGTSIVKCFANRSRVVERET